MHELNRQQPLYVEFVGFPGAGKTTVSLELVPQLVAQQYRCVVRGNGRWARDQGQYGSRKAPSHKNRGIFGKAFVYLTLHVAMWRLAARAYASVLSEGRIAENRIRAVRSLLQALNGIRGACQIVLDGEADLLIYSQGFAAYLREMGLPDGPTARTKLTRLAGMVAEVLAPARVVLVVFELDPETAVARIQQRPEQIGRYDRMSREEALRELHQQRPSLEAVVESLSRAGAVHGVLRVDAAEAPEENARLIADFILQQLSISQPAAPVVLSRGSSARGA